MTLVGGGGVGKTRLALEVALQAGDPYPRSGGLGGARAAGGRRARPPFRGGGAGHPRCRAARSDAEALTRRLVARLADGVPLLVLDNCEHCWTRRPRWSGCCSSVPGAAGSGDQPAAAGAAGRSRWRVPSLPATGIQGRERSGRCPDRLSTNATAVPAHPNAEPLEYPAVRLFVERAAAVSPGFRLASGAEAAAVAPDLPPAGWHSPGDRAGRGAGDRVADGRADRGAPGRPLPAAHRRGARRAAAPADAAGADRLEL